MELSQNKIINSKFYKVFLILFALTFITWWSGIAGASLYAIPGLLLVVISTYAIIKGQYFWIINELWKNTNEIVKIKKYQKIIILLFLIQSLLWILYVILKYYSFNLFTFDVGFHSNIIFNISNGSFYSSYYNMNNLGDHFTPSLAFVSIFYKIYPSTLWVMVLKVLSYISCIYFFYLILKKLKINEDHIPFIFIIICLGWLFFYKPIINSVRYEFQASSLTPPLILLAYILLLEKKWIYFILIMLLTLGFKEHLGSVLIGFGCHKILKKPCEFIGYILIIIGVVIIYLMFFEIKPYFRDYGNSFNDINLIDPFKDLDLKMRYFFIFLLNPLFFIPLIFWKNGILSLPAIGVNLISGWNNMYSSHYHYDDVSSTLLFLSILISVKEIKLEKIKNKLIKSKLMQFILILWFVIFLYNLPYSNLRMIKKIIPNENHLLVERELEEFKSLLSDEMIAVQDSLGAHFHRKNIQVIHFDNKCEMINYFKKSSISLTPIYFVFSRYVPNYGTNNNKNCLNKFVIKNKLIKLDRFKKIDIYKRSKL